MIGHLSYIVLGINPIGAMLVAIPFGLFEMKYAPWIVGASAPLLNYVQVIAVDVAWDALTRWPWFKRTLEQKRSARVERLVNGGGAFWAVFVATPIIGAWVIMAFMRYAHVPQRKVAAPMLLALYVASTAMILAWVYVPELFSK